jgi:2-Cys peroxiredoxin 5
MSSLLLFYSKAKHRGQYFRVGERQESSYFRCSGRIIPGCSKIHLPSFITAQDELKAKGVELTICIATNDAYVVMEARGRTSGGIDAGILFLSDSNVELTRAPLGLKSRAV